MISAWDSTRSESTSNDASASAANPLPMWVTNVPTTSCKRKQKGTILSVAEVFYSPTFIIDLAKPKSGTHIFFLCMSQGHNSLPWPGLELRSSDLEPSALITGQSRGIGVPAIQLTTHVKSSTSYSRTVIRSYNQIFSA